jgi:phage tail-like protein
VDEITRHVLLRDRRDWLGTRTGLTIDRSGALTLARVPAPANGKALEVATTYPYAREMSGIALGPCNAVFVADTAHHRVLYVDALCGSQAWLGGDGAGAGPGQYDRPRGLAFTLDALLVADSGNARLQSLALPALEAHRLFGGWATPTSLAVDSKQRVLVVDAAAKRLRRIEGDGMADPAFDAAIVAGGKLAAPLSVAIGHDDRIVVSDGTANRVFVFDADGAFLFELDGPAGWLPGAVAALDHRTYAADAGTGRIYAFDDASRAGFVPGYRGPVTALAVAESGDLYVKPGLDAAYFQLVADSAYVDHGELTAGPFDAGETRDFERAWVDATRPPGTTCTVEVVQKPAAAPAPLPNEWRTLMAQDVLLSVLDATLGKGDRRYVWLRVRLSTEVATQSPRVDQVRAATAAENYLDYLPSTYGRNDERADGQEGFLRRLLKLLRGRLAQEEEWLDDMPRIADARFLPGQALPWLAQWLAFELPQIASEDERRALIARAVALFARRGAPESIARFVELHTGVRPTILEGFEDRRFWQLGTTSRLDFDTRLPPLDPLGMVVPDDVPAECCEQPASSAPCPCDPPAADAPLRNCATGPIGRAIVGESGPLASYQIGLPLFAEDAYRFCVFVDGYRAQRPETLAEIRRIVDREKPAHTDYRVALLEPDLRVGLQARVGIDAILGGDPPGFHLAAQLGLDTRLAPSDHAARVGDALLGEALTLT